MKARIRTGFSMWIEYAARIMLPIIDMYQNATGTWDFFLYSLTIHCRTNLPPNTASPIKAVASQYGSSLICKIAFCIAVDKESHMDNLPINNFNLTI